MAGTASRQEPPPVHLKVVLTIPDKPAREFSYDFSQPVISMGRDPSNDIQIPLTTVSRRHARIFYEVGDYFLEDLGSTHGTEHNGRRIPNGEKRLLRDGDEIRVMTFAITFKTTAHTPLDRQPGEKTEALARRMVQEVLSSLGGDQHEPPALRIMNGPDEGKRYELAEDASELTLGRSPDCDITLNDHNVSRRHCLIKRDWHGFTAQDLGSKNGVILNGKVIQGAQLIKDGDELQIGGVKLIFIDPPSRLLDKIGGPELHTLDPSQAQPEPEHAQAEEEDDYVESDPHHDPEPADEPVSSSGYSQSDLHAEDDEEEPLPEIEIPPELQQVAKKGWTAELLILVVGGAALLAAVGVVLFLVL
ncbi:MAG: FHA domain-containing protein [Myxococcales bacterium]|nr:FHA domain-containing protein [Myxococcales bacterium]